jgi:hypothetical protein
MIDPTKLTWGRSGNSEWMTTCGRYRIWVHEPSTGSGISPKYGAERIGVKPWLTDSASLPGAKKVCRLHASGEQLTRTFDGSGDVKIPIATDAPPKTPKTSRLSVEADVLLLYLKKQRVQAIIITDAQRGFAAEIVRARLATLTGNVLRLKGRRRPGHPRGYSPRPATRERMRVSHTRGALDDEELFQDVPVPSTPDTSPNGTRRSNLLDDLAQMVNLAREMVGGVVPSDSIPNWQAWVDAIGHEIRHHLRRVPEAT